MKNTNFKNYCLYFFIALNVITFIFGFFLNENSTGSGGYSGDIFYIWNNQNTFNNYELKEALNFTAIYDPVYFQSSKFPGSYVLNKVINPFSNNLENLRISVFLMSFVIPFFLFFSIAKKFKTTSKIKILFLSTIIFLSPYFRTSGYWALEENYAILVLVLAAYYFNKNLENKKSFSNIFYLTFFSSLCVYFDQKFIIVPMICYLNFIFSKIDLKYKFYITFLYSIFSIPVLYMIYLWGSVLPVSDSIHRNVGIINPSNIIYSTSIIAFYLFPLLFLKKFNFSKIQSILKSKINIIIFFFVITFIIYFLNSDFYDQVNLGGGFLNKLSIFFFTENILLQKYFLSLGFLISSLIILTYLNNCLHDYLIIIFLIFLSIFINPFYQEYFDPLIFLLAILFFKSRLNINSNKVLIPFFYYILLLFFNIVYY